MILILMTKYIGKLKKDSWQCNTDGKWLAKEQDLAKYPLTCRLNCSEQVYHEINNGRSGDKNMKMCAVVL